MKITELKAGDRIYDFDQFNVKRYTYLCVHPTGGGKYHILIDQVHEPVRIYETRLQEILDKNLNSYNEATLQMANLLEEKAKSLRTQTLS